MVTKVNDKSVRVGIDSNPFAIFENLKASNPKVLEKNC